MNKSYAVHAPIDPITVWINEKVFYDMDESKNGWIKSKIFGLTCLKGQSVCFEIITDTGCVFSNIPPQLIKFKENVVEDELKSLSDLVYFNCPSEEFSLNYFDYLASKKANVFFKRTNETMLGTYLFSIDFYNANNWYHCLMLENGQFAFVPSHKIIFSENKLDNVVFPDYKKLRHTFSV